MLSSTMCRQWPRSCPTLAHGVAATCGRPGAGAPNQGTLSPETWNWYLLAKPFYPAFAMLHRRWIGQNSSCHNKSNVGSGRLKTRYRPASYFSYTVPCPLYRYFRMRWVTPRKPFLEMDRHYLYLHFPHGECH